LFPFESHVGYLVIDEPSKAPLSINVIDFG